MKITWKHFTLKHYIRYVRRQNKHLQHMHAFVFAGTITGLLATFIMYTDYGFWHERYDSDEVIAAKKEAEVKLASPGATFTDFFSEAKVRLSAIGTSNLLEGKETYVNTGESDASTSQK